MSNEVSQQSGPGLGMYVLMPAMTMGVGAVRNMRRWGLNPKEAISHLAGANTDAFIERVAPDADFFTKSTLAGQVGESYKSRAKAAGKFEKKAAKKTRSQWLIFCLAKYFKKILKKCLTN